MTYINPLDILQLTDYDVSTIDSTLIKKAKRKLFADIDLSDDNCLEYHGLKLSKSDCEKKIYELEEKANLVYYYYLSKNKKLNNLLINGNTDFFFYIEHTVGFDKLPGFKKFLSTYFLVPYGTALVTSLNNYNVSLLNAVLKGEILLEPQDVEKAFKPLYDELQKRLSNLNSITEEIKNERSNYTEKDIEDILFLVQREFPYEILNLLPNYFYSQISNIAASINYLQLAIVNMYNSFEIPVKLLEYLFKLEFDSLHKPTFLSNYEIMKKKLAQRIEQEKYAPEIAKWSDVIVKLIELSSQLENKKITPNQLLVGVKSLVPISTTNQMPDAIYELKLQICLVLNNISVKCWNLYEDYNIALEIINIALDINLDIKDQASIKESKKELLEIGDAHKCFFCGQNISDAECGLKKTIYRVNNVFNEYGGRRVNYSYIDLEIPRCRECKTVHDKIRNLKNGVYFNYIFWGIVLGALGVFINKDIVFGAAIIGAIIGFIVGAIRYNEVKDGYLKKAHIKDDSDSTIINHPILYDKMRTGWTFNKPEA